MFQIKVVEKIKTDILRSILSSFESRAIYEIMWKKKTVKADRPQVAIQYGAEKMRFACRMTKARLQTTTHHIIVNNIMKYFVAGQQ